MKVADSNAVAQLAAQAKPEPQSTDKPKANGHKQSQASQPAVKSEAVSISAQATKAAESSGANQEAKQAKSANEAPKENLVEAKSQESQPAGVKSFSREVSRDYSVDSGQVVVKVIDKSDGEVVREIPPEEQRRIKEAIAEMNKNSVASDVKAASADVANAASKGESGGVEPGVDITM